MHLAESMCGHTQSTAPGCASHQCRKSLLAPMTFGTPTSCSIVLGFKSINSDLCDQRRRASETLFSTRFLERFDSEGVEMKSRRIVVLALPEGRNECAGRKLHGIDHAQRCRRTQRKLMSLGFRRPAESTLGKTETCNAV
jgi:hypothetical protein